MHTDNSNKNNDPNIDTIFKAPQEKGQFSFNNDVVAVFDDMIERSIPFYREIQHLITQFVSLNAKQENPVILDIGCSTGNTLYWIDYHSILNNPTLIGIDASYEMISKAKEKYPKLSCKWVHSTLENYSPPKSDIIILNLCLQFTNPKDRKNILKKYYDALNKNGHLILIEKTLPEEVNRENFKHMYHAFKRRQNYSETEITNKDIALDGVLRPITEKENVTLLEDAGFSSINTLYCWCQFHGWIASK